MKTGNATGLVSSTPTGINCGADCSESYPQNQVVVLTATPDTGARFLGWTGGGCVGTGPCTLTVTASVTVSAAFALEHTLVVTRAGTGSGVVTSTPAGIDCGTDCTEAYAAGTAVTLTASPNPGSTFAGWSMACTGTGPCTVTVTTATMVTATFTQQFPLTVVTTGSGSGTVTSNPAGINCGPVCTSSFDSGTQVTLTASPAMGSTFTGWSGGGCSGTGTCVTTVTSAAAVVASFAQLFPLTVSRMGTGSGTVQSTPMGIDCGTTCSLSYPSGSTVLLTATAATGSTFVGWSGGGCSGTGTCLVTLTAATSVTATFTLESHAVTVVTTGSGSGTVASSPPGINCGSDCTESWPYGTMVQFVPVPAANSVFAGWSGGCTGMGTCIVNVTGPVTVTASFTSAQVALTVTLTGAGAGTVTSSPVGIACGTDCSELYTPGTMVTLTAAPAMGSSFAGWSGGGCTGTGTCVVTMNAATAVTATFSCASGSVTLTYTGAAQSFTVPACAATITVDARGAAGGNGWNVDSGGSAKGTGGRGGRVQATLAVMPGDVLAVYVGGAGRNATTTMPGAGGFNGGGNGGSSMFGYAGGGGGGATDVRRGSGMLADRILVAGGGGSGSGWCTSGVGNGGVGGGLVGGSGQACVGSSGTGGTQSAGGTANGAFGVGGSIASGSQASSAGGGGWYGGGAHDGSGGGGGSSYVVSAGSSAVTHTPGFQAGNGEITISW